MIKSKNKTVSLGGQARQLILCLTESILYVLWDTKCETDGVANFPHLPAWDLPNCSAGSKWYPITKYEEIITPVFHFITLQLSALHSRKRILRNQSFKFSWNWWPFNYCISLFQQWNILLKLTFNSINYKSFVFLNHSSPTGFTI